MSPPEDNYDRWYRQLEAHYADLRILHAQQLNERSRLINPIQPITVEEIKNIGFPK